MITEMQHPTRLQYRPDIDGMRAVAVLSVILFHAFPQLLPGGFTGVDVFFVISGYLISGIIFRNLDNQTFSLYEFYGRRIRRIFPALSLVLISSLCFGWIALLPEEYEQLGKHTGSGSIFISNLVLWSEAGYFDNSAETKPLLHLWSLGIEEQFYIVFPLILMLAWKIKRNNGVAVIIILLLIASFATNISTISENPTGAFYSPITRFWELLSGGLLAWFTVSRTGSPHHNILSCIAFFLLICGFFIISDSHAFPGFWAAIPVLGTFLLIASGSDAWINRKVLSQKLLVWLGLISYPLYLWHWPLLSFARILEGDTPSAEIRSIAIAASFILSALTYQLVEKPLRHGKHQNLKIIFLVLLMLTTGITGFIICAEDGFPSRFQDI